LITTSVTILKSHETPSISNNTKQISVSEFSTLNGDGNIISVGHFVVVFVSQSRVGFDGIYAVPSPLLQGVIPVPFDLLGD
tara:strand:- start:291 stop:533 length:243 start_codon:yes stop_codon:yes gene_type:complete